MPSSRFAGKITGVDGLEITWLGHATAAVEIDGTRFLTDPALTSRLAVLRRHHEVDATNVTADVVLISHVHIDHLHLPSLRLLGRSVQLVVPDGAGRFLRRHGFPRVRETRVGETFELSGVEVATVPARHPNRRGPHSRVAAAAVGYVLRGSAGSVYFAGDTDLFDGMADLGTVDVALLPIAGWGPSVAEGHLDPARAVTATELVRPRLVVPIHWGTYSPLRVRPGPPGWLEVPALEFTDRLATAGHGERLRLLRPGRGLSVPAPSNTTPRT
jgi:L-ascorbate metabolism protein UlaG (beta-lactamase superfamily)